MKIPNKVVSVVCAASMIMAVSASAFAVETDQAPASLNSTTYGLDPSYMPETFRGITQENPGRMIEGESGDCFMAYNPGSGDTGEVLFVFEAKTSSVSFSVNCNRAIDPFTYHFQLYRVNGGDFADSKIGPAYEVSFDTVLCYDNLSVGAGYYIKGSSMNVPKNGAPAQYKYYFNE